MRPRLIAALFAASLLLGACGNGSAAVGTIQQDLVPTLPPTAAPTAAPPTAAPPTAAPTAAPPTAAPPTAAPTAAPASALDELSIAIAPVVQGFKRPTHVTNAGDGSKRLFVVEQAGAIWIVQNGKRVAQPFLDMTELVESGGSEQGLLSVAFHPRYNENGLFFVDYTAKSGDSVLARYRVSPNANVADPSSAMVLLTIEDPAANHNGGLLKFGPDGYLYLGMGDGGGGGDPWGSGQSLDTLLGKILRIDVDSGEPYAIPPDNPFIGQDGARPEIWAWGLRNPWRFSFDRLTGDLYIADVGQNAYEEVNVQPAGSSGGENYGWNSMEADHCYNADSCDPSGLQLPVAVYSHRSQEGGCSITGGYVYRGAQFPQLGGIYLYTDYCTGYLWALRGEDGTWQSQIVGRLAVRASSFGEDEAGELYVTDSAGGGLYRIVVE